MDSIRRTRTIAVFLMSKYNYQVNVVIDVDSIIKRYKSTPVMFQIDNKERGAESETLFKVYCPEQYNHFPMKLMMHNNGSVSNNFRYQDLCVERFAVNVAYNHETEAFEV